MPTDISDIRKKIERANMHLGVLDSENARFMERCRCKIVDQFEPKTSKHVYIISGNPPVIAPSFPMVLGEAIYQLRTALDHLVHQLAIAEADRVGGIVTKSTQRGFPVFKNEPAAEDHESRFKGKVQGLSAHAIADIADLQPWKVDPAKTGDYELTVLDELHNSDKHRLLTVVAGSMNIAGMGIGHHPNMVGRVDHISGSDFKPFMELKDGAEIGHATGNAGLKVDIKTTFSIALPKVGSTEFKPVVALLKQLRDFVVRTVDALSVHL